MMGVTEQAAMADFARLAGYFPKGELRIVPGDHGGAWKTPEFAEQLEAFLCPFATISGASEVPG